MTVIVCLDNANGMMFNHRRQSRDANVVKDILKTINGASLLIAPYLDSPECQPFIYRRLGCPQVPL